jgi:hypothetical protein
MPKCIPLARWVALQYSQKSDPCQQKPMESPLQGQAHEPVLTRVPVAPQSEATALLETVPMTIVPVIVRIFK